MTIDLKKTAKKTLETMLASGFDDAQVTISINNQDELNIAQNEPSLLRSTEDYSLSLVGLVGQRKASTTLTDLEEGALAPALERLLDAASNAPDDDANAVSNDETGEWSSGPSRCDLELLTAKARELLAWREQETPLMNVEEGVAAHQFERSLLLTSRGTELYAENGCYQLSAFGTATDGEHSSSFNYAGGVSHDLGDAHAAELFGIGEMMRDTEQQITTSGFDGNFTGDVILAPNAVSDLIGWLLGQLSDFALISGASLYRDRVGDPIAADSLSISSWFDHPGGEPFSADGFNAPPFTLVDRGNLTRLIPGLYGSRKTGIQHTPTASGWRIAPGSTGLADMIAQVDRGALVNRLSMGSPGPKGDFSGVIKNSFKIEGGKRGGALSETMISGNMATMLKDIVALSREHQDSGFSDYPWILVPGLHFS